MYSKQSGKALFPLIILILIGFCLYLYLPQGQSKQSNRASTSTPVQAYKITQRTSKNTIEALGTARSNQAIDIISAESDYIKTISFEDGMFVKQGQTLIQLQNDEELYRVQELEILLQDEQRKLTRLEKLAQTQAAARSALDEQRAQFEATKTQLAGAKIKLAELTITAPFSGRLGKKEISLGAYVDNNTLITTLDDTSLIKTDFNIPEKYVSQVTLGMEVTASSPAYPGVEFTGKVSHIGTRIDANTRSLPITASFNNDNHKLRSGMLLYSQLTLAASTQLSVPEKSLIPQQDKHFVYVINEQKSIEKRAITIDHRQQGWVSVTSGLQDGDVIVTEGIIKVRPGSSVSVKEYML